MKSILKISISFFAIGCLLIVGLTFVLVGNNSAHAQIEAQDNATYIVKNFSDLAEIASDVNSGKYDGYYGITFILAHDLNIEEDCMSFDGDGGWVPIGTSMYPFKGTFDGNGHTISGLYIDNENMENVGLFGVANMNASIKNLTVQGSVNGSNYTGGLVGYSQAIIENSTNLVSVSAQDDSLHVGGIVGYNFGKISQSKNYGEVRVGFSTFVGGVAGSNSGAIDKCFNSAEISSFNPVVGGIAGNNAGNIDECANTGNISGKSSVGGIVGNNQGSIANVFSKSISNSVNGLSGGIAGCNESSGSIMFSLSACKVEGLEDVASICGYNMGVVSNVFYDETISSKVIVNGLAAENSKGLPTRLAVHNNTLEKEDKLLALTYDNDEVWIKRESSDGVYFYPEIKYFYENDLQISSQISSGACISIWEEDVSLDATVFTYNGSSHEIGVFLGGMDLVLGQDYRASYSDSINAGNQDMTIEFLGIFTGIVVKDFKIDKSTLEAEWENLDFRYDGQPHLPQLKIIDGLIDGEEVVFEYSASSEINAGEYDIVAELALNFESNSNYYLPLSVAKFTISKAPLTAVWSDETFVYNGSIQLPLIVDVIGGIYSDEISFEYEYDENINAGEQQICAILANTQMNANYEFAKSIHIYFIAPAPLEVIWDDTPIYYDGTARYPEVVRVLGVIGNDEVRLTYLNYLSNVCANEEEEYFVDIALADTITNKNYTLSNSSHKYNILKTPLTIEWWGTPLIYNGQPQYPEFYIDSGLVGNDEVTFLLSDYSNNINACCDDIYEVEISLADTTVNRNYLFEKTIKMYKIEKSTFNPQTDILFKSQTFGFDGSAKSIFVDMTLPSGVNVEYENNGQTEIGEYLVTAKFSVDLQNYFPITNNILEASLFIAKMIFVDHESNITVTNKSEALYGLTLNLERIEKVEYKQKGKKFLLAYNVTFIEGIAEYSLPIDEMNLRDKELSIVYVNSSGERVGADIEIIDNCLVFSAEDAISFAIFIKKDLMWLWILLIIVGTVSIITSVLIIRKKQSLKESKIFIANMKVNNDIISHEVANAIEEIDSIITEEKNIVVNNVKENNSKSFYLDGVFCQSYEWFLKSLNVKTIDKQKRICAGDLDAVMLKESLSRDTIYWQGKRYRICSKSYEDLINRAKEAINEKN